VADQIRTDEIGIIDGAAGVRPKRRPEWIKVRAPSGETYEMVRGLMRSKHLHTVCEEAMCPNLGECWGAGTATFLMLGDTCTRSCRFCDIKTGRPAPLDWQEPNRIAQSVKAMDLRNVVITSVNRDERKDGGAPIFAMVIRRIRQVHPGCSIEVLIPDFKGSEEALKIVMDAQPEILNHNVETVPRLYPAVRPQADYARSLAVLRQAADWRPAVPVKSGLMVGLGEERDEVMAVLGDLRAAGVMLVTIGQYMQPRRGNLPVVRYVHPDEFRAYERDAMALGFRGVFAGPLVRSSYLAEQLFRPDSGGA